MEVVEHVAALRGDGALLAEAASGAGLDAPVPYCPSWRVRNLVGHIGGVHRWAAAYVDGARPRPMDDEDERRIMAPPDDDGALADWFVEGHAHLVKTLEAAPADLACWSFLRGRRPGRAAVGLRQPAQRQAARRSAPQAAPARHRHGRRLAGAGRAGPDRRLPRGRRRRLVGARPRLGPVPAALESPRHRRPRGAWRPRDAGPVAKIGPRSLELERRPRRGHSAPGAGRRGQAPAASITAALGQSVRDRRSHRACPAARARSTAPCRGRPAGRRLRRAGRGPGP